MIPSHYYYVEKRLGFFSVTDGEITHSAFLSDQAIANRIAYDLHLSKHEPRQSPREEGQESIQSKQEETSVLTV